MGRERVESGDGEAICRSGSLLYGARICPSTASRKYAPSARGCLDDLHDEMIEIEMIEIEMVVVMERARLVRLAIAREPHRIMNNRNGNIWDVRITMNNGIKRVELAVHTISLFHNRIIHSC